MKRGATTGNAPTGAPTFAATLAAYRDIAAIERTNTGKPSTSYVYGVEKSVARVLDACGLTLDAPLSAMDCAAFSRYIEGAKARGMKARSLRVIIAAFRSLGEDWTRKHYEARGMKPPTFDTPHISLRKRDAATGAHRRVLRLYEGQGQTATASDITFHTLFTTYKSIAETERIKMGKPSKTRQFTTINAARCILQGCGLDENATLDELTRERMDEYAVKALTRGVKPISVYSYFEALRGFTARWTREYYAARKMYVQAFNTPRVRIPPRRYQRPSKETINRVAKWYKDVESKNGIIVYCAVALMLNFAMRNSDVLRLTWGNFKEQGDAATLEYTPHKTALSSGRRVVCRVPNTIWRRLKRLRGKDATDATRVFSCSRYIFRKVNKSLRDIGFTGSKGAYELRKLCIDCVYRNFGAEAASAISGDDIKTVLKYYADGSICNIGNVCISDLMTNGQARARA